MSDDDASVDAEVRALADRARAEQARLRGELAEASAALSTPVHAEFDDVTGALARLVFDDDRRRSRSSVELLADIRVALASAPLVLVPASAGVDELVRASRRLAAALSSLTVDGLPSTAVVEDPDAPLRVRALFGKVVEIEAEESWVLGRSSAELGERIVALAHRAAAEFESGTEERA